MQEGTVLDQPIPKGKFNGLRSMLHKIGELTKYPDQPIAQIPSKDEKIREANKRKKEEEKAAFLDAAKKIKIRRVLGEAKGTQLVPQPVKVDSQ